MLSGDSYGRAVAVPVPLILSLVERVQRMTPTANRKGPQVLNERREMKDDIFIQNLLVDLFE